ncbi:MAG: SDR family oxidoreductase [Nitriliruptoraceae bacterium]
MGDRVDGMRAVVTGGARGIGGAIVPPSVEEGAEVVIADIRDEQEAIAPAALSLASDESAFVTGAELYVDGGFVAT